MATAKATESKTVAKKIEDAAKEPTLVDGVYTEHEVKIGNGTTLPVSVITDPRKLPASWGSLVAEGNGPALIMASLTANTRRMLDMAGATLDDVDNVLSEVVKRAQEASNS